MKRLYYFLLFFLCWNTISGQLYQHLDINGFNADVIANGVGIAASSTSKDIDGVGYCLKSIDWQLKSTSTPQINGLPVNGLITSGVISTKGLTYQLQNYNQNNSIRLAKGDYPITSEVGGEVRTNRLHILATSASGSAILGYVVTFTDNTSQSSQENISDWFGGDTSIASQGVGRINIRNSTVENSLTNPRLYQVTLNIDIQNQNKQIKSIQFSNKEGIGIINVFAVSAEKCNPVGLLSFSSITDQSFVVSWNAPIDIPTEGYEYEIRTIGLPGDGVVGLVSSGKVSNAETSKLITGLTANTAYHVYIRALCSTTLFSEWKTIQNILTKCTPPIVIALDSSVCELNSANLTATAKDGTIKWYATEKDSNVLAEGNNYTTPILSETTSYWVDAATSFATINSGKATHTTSNDLNTFTNWGIVFDLSRDAYFKSTDVYLGKSGTMNVMIVDSSGIELFSTGDIVVDSLGTITLVTIPLGVELKAGKGYRIQLKSWDKISLYRDSGVDFPLIDNKELMKVTSGYFDGVTNDYYYYFYNNVLEEICRSARKEIVVKVNKTPPPVARAVVQNFCVGTNPSLASIEIQGKEIKWYTSESGGVNLPMKTPLTDKITYYATQTLNGCESNDRTAVNIALEDSKLKVSDTMIGLKYGTDTNTILGQLRTSLGTSDLIWYAEKKDLASISMPDFSVMPVGIHKYWVSTFSLGGCESKKATITLAIYPATIVVNSQSTVKVYGSLDPHLDYKVLGLVNNDKQEDILSGNLSRGIGENVGTYLINKGTLTANSNYTVDFKTANLTIGTAPLTVAANKQSKEYGAVDPKLDYIVSGLVNNDKETTVLTGRLDRTVGENASTYVINQGDLKANSNYTLAFKTANLTIAKAPLTVTANKQSKVYGAFDSKLDYVVSGLVNNDKETAVLSGGLSRAIGENVGVYAINQNDLKANSNYSLSYVSNNLVITPATISGLSLMDAIYTYDGTERTLMLKGNLPSDMKVFYTANKQTEVGVYQITALVTGANYKDLTLMAKLTITKAKQHIEFDQLSPVIYNTNLQLQLSAVSSSGLPITYSSGDEVGVAIVDPLGLVKMLKPGRIVITAQQAGNSNYEPAQNVSQVLLVQNDEAIIEGLSINGSDVGKISSNEHFTVDCEDIDSQVTIALKTSAGANVSTGNNFVIRTPKAGIYRQEIIVKSQSERAIKKYVIEIERPFVFGDIVTQKFNNTLIANNNPLTNGGYTFTRYRWFRNGQLIGKGQVYSVGNNKEDLLDRDALYSVELTTDKGEVLHSCSSTIRYSNTNSIKLYPNPIVKQGELEIAIDYPDLSLKDVTASIYSVTGQFLFKTVLQDRISKVALPYTLVEGSYIMIIKIDGKNKTFRFIVKPN